MSLNEAKRLYKQGQRKLAAGDLEGAIAKFRQALQFNPKDYLALSGLGEVMLKLERYEEAISYYDQSLEIKPNYHPALHMRGVAFYQLGRYEQAFASLNAAQKANSGCANGWQWHGNVLLALEQYEEAIKSFDLAIKLNRKDGFAWGNRGIALFRIGAYQKAIESLDQALMLQPETNFRFTRGIALDWLDRYEEAIENFNYILKYHPNDHPTWYSKGHALMRLNRYEEAIVSYDRAIEIYSAYTLAWSGRGRALSQLKRYEDAFISYRRALELDPGCNDAWAYQGLTLDELGRYEEAISSYDQAIRINPSSFMAWNNRGSALASLDQHEKALESFVQASQIDPQRPTAWLGQGDALNSLGRFSDAQAAYEKALALDPNNPSLWASKGNVLRRQSFFHEAISACDNALGLDDQLSLAWTNLGLSIWDTQGFEAAIEKLDEAFLKLKQESPQYLEACGKLYGWKGYIYYQEGQKREDCFKLWRKAASCYQMALRSLEQTELQENYLETLQSLTKVFLGLGQVEEAELLLAEGTEQLQRLLDPEKTLSPGKRKLLALKFAGFDQLTVDRHLQAASQLEDKAAIQVKLKDAWETAEKGKNTCLSWLLYALSDEVAKPRYEEVQQFLSPGTALAYWHLSPAALTTFVLKLGELAPIVITQPSSGDRPASLQQLLKLEAWMKEWDDQYSDYRNKGKEQRNANHSWRRDMAQRLFERQEEPGNLREILNIEAIAQHLDGINHLILIPHRDLHRFPLHALFSDRFTVSYLPSLQVGLNLKGRQPTNINHLFSIENPTSAQAPDMRLALLESQMISQYFQNVRSLQEADATHARVIDALSEKNTIFHFSGHGSHHSENPKKSELLLAGTESLTLEDICQQDLTTYDLVSLSACETALTNNQSITTEYVGLVSGFLSQGAAQVLSTLWVVKSAVSAVVMIEFYRARQSAKSDAVALAETIRWFRSLNQFRFEQWCQDCLKDLATLPRKQRAAINRMFDLHIRWRWDSIEEDVQHPYAWASFILSGGFFS